MTTNQNQLPPFGDLLNAGIQTIKGLSRRASISQNMFYREFDKHAQITQEHKKITFMSRLDIRLENTDGTSCYDNLTSLVLLSLSAIGLIKEYCFNLQPHIDQNFASFIPFNEQITPRNLHMIDPMGKIFFWLAQDSFSDYIHDYGYLGTNDCVSNLKRFDERAYSDLKNLNITAYGSKGDPLINYIISEATRRTSLFMNNYQGALAGDDYAPVTLEIIMKQLESLTPLQFEWFCLKLVERSLENENPETNLTCRHTGKSNDGGIDGLILQDFPDGDVHNYYIQAKLYAEGNNISNRDLRNFIGALPPQKVNHHGIFITTTDFTKPALDYAEGLESHSLILINHMALIDLIMEHKVGLKQVDLKPKLVMDNEFFEKIKHY